MIAFSGAQAERRGLMYARADGSMPTFLAEMSGTNSPLPGQGEDLVVAGQQDDRVRFVDAGPESKGRQGDPMVITRYLYKPTATEGMTHFNDNQRLASICRRHCVEAIEAIDQRHLRRAFHRLVAGWARRFCLSRTGSRIRMNFSTTTSLP